MLLRLALLAILPLLISSQHEEISDDELRAVGVALAKDLEEWQAQNSSAVAMRPIKLVAKVDDGMLMLITENIQLRHANDLTYGELSGARWQDNSTTLSITLTAAPAFEAKGTKFSTFKSKLLELFASLCS